MTCPNCGEAVADGARFCSSCGQPMSTRDDDQRRVVTVLFADLVGFTSLSEGTDPEQVKRLVDGCFEELVAIVEAFGGRVDKIIGDAVLALFGAPVGHEDDAERAVRAALRMQETLHAREAASQLRLRIGVNTGEVLVGALRSGGDYTAMGDVVNTAQRLETAAGPGQVLVGPSTHAAAGEHITYEEIGPLAVRGRDETVHAWRAVDTLEPPGRRRRRMGGPLVGRRREMAVLGGEIDLAVQRRRAQVILLVGDAGVGKSRLARELVDYAAGTHAAWVLQGTCVPYGEANVWWPVAEALRQATGLAADATGIEARSAVTELTARLRGVGAADPDVRRIVDGVLELLGYEGPLREIDAGRAREEAMRALIDLIDAAAADHPVVVVINDLHWADQVVLDTIDRLVTRLGRNPYVVVGTARAMLQERWSPPAGRHDTTVMHLEPLEREAADALLTRLADPAVDRRLRDEVLDRSGGNPFFIEELVALLDETGSTEGAPVSVRADHDVPELTVLPDSLRGLVVARLDALGSDERAVVENAAVLGRRGPMEALELMAAESGTPEHVAGAVADLVDKELFHLDDGHWSFRSELVRDVAYGTMTKARRAVRHAGVATWLEHHLGGPETLDRVIDQMAHHYGTAAQLVVDTGGVDGLPADLSARALHWIGEAGARALESEHHPVGANLFSHALLILGDEPSVERWEALLGRSRCLANMRELAEGRKDAETVLAEARQAEDPTMTGRALIALGDIQQKDGDLAASRSALTEAIDLLAAAGADQHRGEALRLRGMAELFAGDRTEAEASISAALDVARAVGDGQGEAWALQNLAWLAFESGRIQDAGRWIDQSIAAFTEIGDPGGLGWALGLAAWVKMHLGEREEAARIATDLLPEAEARGDRWGVAMINMLLASVHLWSGRVTAALGPAAEAEAAFARAGDAGGETQARVTSGRAMLMAGRVAEGWALLGVGRSGEDDDPMAALQADRTALIGLTLGAVALGDPGRARLVADRFDEGSLDVESIGGVDLLAGVALLHLQLGEVDRAGDLVEAFAPAGVVPRPALAAAAALVEVCRGRPVRARTLARSVPGARGATFADRFTASIALALLAAADRDEAACAQHFTAARSELEGTDDRLDGAVSALAEAMAYEALEDPVAEEAAENADRRWGELGVDPAGWRTVFGRALVGVADR